MVDLDKGGRIPQVVRTYCGPSTGWVYTDSPTSIEYVIDGGGAQVTTGIKGPLIIPDWCVINDWWLLADQIGSAVVDIWKTPKASYPPTLANSITGSALPTLAGFTFSQSSNLTGWTTLINQGDVLVFVVASASVIQRLTIVLECVRVIGQE